MRDARNEVETVGRPLVETELDDPRPGPGQLALDVLACGVCRTDLHIVDGELAVPQLPVTPGHQIVARVRSESRLVGVPWLGWTCGDCAFCRSSCENLCTRGKFTGLHRDGGFATAAVADAAFCLPLADDADRSRRPRCSVPA